MLSILITFYPFSYISTREQPPDLKKYDHVQETNHIKTFNLLRNTTWPPTQHLSTFPNHKLSNPLTPALHPPSDQQSLPSPPHTLLFLSLSHTSGDAATYQIPPLIELPL